MPALLPDVDPDGLQEFSVVFTDRSLNHMSAKFQGVMRDISAMLQEVYAADAVALVPGGGTYAMEAVARQFAHGRARADRAERLVLLPLEPDLRGGRLRRRDDRGDGAADRATARGAPYAPPPVDEVVAQIREMRPDVVFAPHVETSAGIILPDDYITAVAAAAHEVGALMVLDCIASGCVWVDMAATGVDVLISAPQKGWSASPSAGLVMLSAAGRGAAGRDDVEQLCHGPEEVARDHGGL